MIQPLVTCLTCLSPWVQKPAGEQTGARGVQWCSVSPAYRLGCRSLPESRQGREVCSGAVSHLPFALGAEDCRRADRSARCAVVQWCSVSPACRLDCSRSLLESRQELEMCSGAVSHLPVALSAEACWRADRSARCVVVQCLTCLSPWVQKPTGEQTGERGVQWCSVSPACRPGCRSLPESRQEREVCSGAVSHLPVALDAEACRRAQGHEVCSGAVVQCLTCLSPWVQKPAGEQTGV